MLFSGLVGMIPEVQRLRHCWFKSDCAAVLAVKVSACLNVLGTVTLSMMRSWLSPACAILDMKETVVKMHLMAVHLDFVDSDEVAWKVRQRRDTNVDRVLRDSFYRDRNALTLTSVLTLPLDAICHRKNVSTQKAAFSVCAPMAITRQLLALTVKTSMNASC
jgi:hypothetical protein